MYEVLFLPFNHLSSVRQRSTIFITVDFGSRPKDVASCIVLLAELACFLGTTLQFDLLVIHCQLTTTGGHFSLQNGEGTQEQHKVGRLVTLVSLFIINKTKHGP